MKKDTDANDSRSAQHLYLRGNFQQDMFFDKVDMINVWNRLWLSAEATQTEILSAEILNNHLHITGIFQDQDHRTRFKRHFRLSITQYHNRRYQVHGTLGTRTLKHAVLYNSDDIKDCICYHIRNVLHHGIRKNFIDYEYSTARYVFGMERKNQHGFYDAENLPENLAHAYLPARVQLPEGWMMTHGGQIVPPHGVFRSDIVESLFGNSREEYLKFLSQRTRREANDTDFNESCADANDSCSAQTPDEIVVEYVKNEMRSQIPSMNFDQMITAIDLVRKKYPKIGYRTLERTFGIPASTIRYHIKKRHGLI